jgi:hypothetical protein
MYCWWCNGNHGTLAPVRFVDGGKVLCTDCRRMFAPEGWHIPMTEEEAQEYCKEAWEGVQ